MNQKQLTKLEIADKYNEHAKWYDIFEGMFEIIFRKHRRKMLSSINGNVLELAVGTGINLKYYSKDCRITGIDLSKEMMEIARKKAKQLGIKAAFKIADAEKLPFKKNTFDTVLETFSLCTYPHPIKALKEMSRVCKKDGRIFLLDHGESSNHVVRRLQSWQRKKHYSRIGCDLLRNHEELARKAGLKISKIERKVFGIIYMIEAKP